MKKVNFTDSQFQAINSNKKLIVVNSSAGTGKTTVLVERIFRIISNTENSIRKILALTFTNNAADEIKIRLQKRLEEALLDEKIDETHKCHLKEQLFLLPNAYISTFHSFCKRYLEEQVDQYKSKTISIVDQEHFQIIVKDCINKVIDKWIKTKKHYDLLLRFLKLNNDNLSNIVIDLHKEALYQGDEFKTYVEKNLKLYENQNDHELASIKNNDLGYDAFYRKCPPAFLALMKKSFLIPFIAEKFKTVFVNDKEKLNTKKNKSLNEICKLALNDGAYFDKLIKDLIDELLTNSSDSENNNDKEQQKIIKLFEQLLHQKENINYYLLNNDSRKLLKKFYNFVLEISEEITIRLQGLGLSTFDNLIYWFWNEFKNRSDKSISSLMKSVMNQFQHILVDEFQDTSVFQYRFIRQLEDKNISIFLVGDSKQSIYRFQDAIPKLFIEVMDRAQKRKDGEVISLRENFRSNNEIISFVNQVFSEIGDVISIDSEFRYAEIDHLITGTNYSKNENSLINISFQKNKPNDKIRVYELLEEALIHIKKSINESNGKLQYNDFMILGRRNFNYVSVKNIAKDLQIPIKGQFKIVFLESSFYSIFFNFLRIIFNINDDIGLLSSFKYVFNISDEDIIKIKLFYHEENTSDQFLQESFFKLCEKYIQTQSEDNSLVKKLKSVFITIKEIQEFFSNNHLLASVEHVLFTHGLYQQMAKFQNASESMQWWKIMKNIIDKVSSSINNNLFDLIEALNPIKPGISFQKKDKWDIIEDENAVSILTAHSAKGLEAKIVIYINEVSKSAKPIDVDPILGIHTDYESDEESLKISPPQRVFINEQEKILTLYDELRLLYVILTRAKEQFIIINHTTVSATKNSNELLSFKDLMNVTKIRGLWDALQKLSVWKKNFINLSTSVDEINDFLKEIISKEKKDIPEEIIFFNKKLCIEKIKKDPDLKQDAKQTFEPLAFNAKALQYGLRVHKLIELILRSLSKIKTKNESIIIEVGITILNKYLADLKLIEEDYMINSLKKDALLFFKNKKFIVWYLEKEVKLESEIDLFVKNREGEMIKGRIDLLILKPNKTAIIIDFKTDVVEDEKTLVLRHQDQLRMYKQGIKVNYIKVEAFLFSTYLNKLIKIDI